MTSSDSPISVEELLKKRELQETKQKPVFLSKKQRELLKLKQLSVKPKEKPVTKKVVLNYEDDIDTENADAIPVRPVKKLKKFNFDWDEDADTSEPQESLILPTRTTRAIDTRLTNEHWSKKPLEEMTDRDWRIMKEDFEISHKGGSILNPLRDWKESDIPPVILNQLSQLQYHEPTPIQRATIPTALSGRDIIGIAETGSGKTLLFIVPILTYILSKPRISERNKDQGPYCLVLVPTRELALQIATEFNKFELDFQCCSIIGGHSFEELIYKIRNGVEIVILTPGRLNDCIERGIIVFNQCDYLVMDEADRMINMGFEIQVQKILDTLPRYRRTMMFTATMPLSIEKLAANYLTKPGVVTIGELGNAVDTVVQEVEFLKDDSLKMSKLLQILKRGLYRPPIIVFVNRKSVANDINTKLTKEGFKCILMHGSKNQDQRELAIASIKNGSSDILIATDIVGRGIDIDDVSLVINYQMSEKIEDYTHRIGRTGRAGKLGHAITFLTDYDNGVLGDLRQIIASSKISKMSEELKKRELNYKSDIKNIVN